MAVIRQYRARHSLTHAPLTLVYAIVMAATAVSFALDIPDPEQGPPPSECETHMKFLLKSLKECSRVYRVAMDASARLEATLKARTQGPASHAASEALSETGQHDGPGDGDDGDSGWPFDWSSWQGLPLLGDELGGVNVTEGFDGIVGTIATEDDDDEVTLACGAAESDDAGALFDWNVTH